jgi:maleylacetoacetate isomerase/maleylpyruvate isomerase
MNTFTDTFILHNYFRSSTSYRARIALNLKGIKYKYVPVHLLKNGGEQHSAEYRKLNPQGEVPTLIHNGKAISQSMAIVEYLEDIHPANPLFPKDPYMKAKVRQFCENINSFMHPLGNLKVMQKLEKDNAYTAEQKNAWIQHWNTQGFQALEEMLKEFSGRYCFGDQVTAADAFLVPVIFASNRFKVDLQNFPLCRKINEECLKQKAFIDAHPFRQMDTPTEERIS